jgi:peptidoglycan/xylan/chitin deacetylase (PgdA/CDA1 family)
MTSPLPLGFDPRTVCLSVDVDWASDAVVADIRGLFDERGLKATFFVTHAGIEVPGHERGLHPNFRRNGDVMRTLAQKNEASNAVSEEGIYSQLVAAFKAFAPEAKGVRAHSLHYDSVLMQIYHQQALQYDSSYQIPLVANLRPFWKEYEVLEIPIYFNDHFELKTGAVGLNVDNLRLGEAGLKVILLHPNMVFLNAASNNQYAAAKPFHHDHERLLEMRHKGRGVRTLLAELLDTLVAEKIPVMTLGEVNEQWRSMRKWQ